MDCFDDDVGWLGLKMTQTHYMHVLLFQCLVVHNSSSFGSRAGYCYVKSNVQQASSFSELVKSGDIADEEGRGKEGFWREVRGGGERGR